VGSDPKADLKRYLQVARDAVLWKLEGLSEYDLRRPVTPTATNLLGLVKHLAVVESGYFGMVFGRPFAETERWYRDEDDPNADMWATPDESRDDIVGFYHRVWAHSDATIDALSLDSIGSVPWWPEERRQVTLSRILVHMTTETHRHAGHADIVRELVDGAAGFRRDASNLPSDDAQWWSDYRERVDQSARKFLTR
jgi:uncharacterized damage-inducible protein DinB